MIPGLPDADSAAVLAVLMQQPGLEQVLLYGSRAMGRHHSGSDVDLCLVAPSLQLEDLLLLGARLDDLLLPWRFDLQLQHRIDHPGFWRTSSGSGWPCSMHPQQLDGQMHGIATSQRLAILTRKRC